MKYITILLFAVLLAAGCQEDDVPKACEVNNTGELCIENATTLEIRVTLDGVPNPFLMTSGDVRCYDLTAGPRTFSMQYVATGNFGGSGSREVIRCQTTDLRIR